MLEIQKVERLCPVQDEEGQLVDIELRYWNDLGLAIVSRVWVGDLMDYVPVFDNQDIDFLKNEDHLVGSVLHD